MLSDSQGIVVISPLLTTAQLLTNGVFHDEGMLGFETRMIVVLKIVDPQKYGFSILECSNDLDDLGYPYFKETSIYIYTHNITYIYIYIFTINFDGQPQYLQAFCIDYKQNFITP